MSHQSANLKLICDALAEEPGPLQVLGARIAVLAPLLLLPPRFTAIETVAVQPPFVHAEYDQVHSAAASIWAG